jgi:hypothetical protein
VDFEIIGEITAIETIATGRGVHARYYLNRVYGRGHWRKMKGLALVRPANGPLRRAIDNSGEDYLYPASYFQPLAWSTLPADWESGHTALTIHLDPRTKAILRAEALAAHTSMGALARQWIEERLEFQSGREVAR